MTDVSDLIDPTGKPLQSNQSKVESEKSKDPAEVNVDYKERYLRALADYQNLKRQVEAERTHLFEFATMSVLEQLIPTLDLLHQAEVFVKDAGLKMVVSQFEKTLTDMGLQELTLVGTDYDPHTAEVVDTIEDDGKENIVKEVVKAGYHIRNRTVRVAQVKVSKKKEKETEKKEDKEGMC